MQKNSDYQSERWLGSLVDTASDLRFNGREFDPRPLHYRPVGILGWVTVFGRAYHLGMYVTSHLGQLSLLPSVGQEMSTGQSAVMRCGWGSKAGWLIAFEDRCVGGR